PTERQVLDVVRVELIRPQMRQAEAEGCDAPTADPDPDPRPLPGLAEATDLDREPAARRQWIELQAHPVYGAARIGPAGVAIGRPIEPRLHRGGRGRRAPRPGDDAGA